MSGQPPSRRQRELILDPDRVRDRRRYLRLSTSALAAALGTSAGVIIRVEHGSGQDKLDLAFVADLSHCLGVSVAELLFSSGSGSPGDSDALRDDTHRLGSMVSAASGWIGVDDLCEATAWPIDRVVTALSALESEAPRLGLRLAWLGWDVSLVPAVIEEGLPRVVPAGRRRGLDIDACRLLYRLVKDDTEHQIRRERPIARRRLVALGIATEGGPKHDVALGLTDEARFNLCLDDVVGS